VPNDLMQMHAVFFGIIPHPPHLYGPRRGHLSPLLSDSHSKSSETAPISFDADTLPMVFHEKTVGGDTFRNTSGWLRI